MRYVHVHDLTCLGDPGTWPVAIPDSVFATLLPPDVPVLAVVPCHPAPVQALLAERGAADRVTVRGWRNPDRPLSPQRLLQHAGLGTGSLTATAQRLLDQHSPTRRRRLTGDLTLYSSRV